MKSGKKKGEQQDLFGQGGAAKPGAAKPGAAHEEVSVSSAPKGSAAAKSPAVQGGLLIDEGAQKRVADSAERIERYRASYYAGKPEISDAAFDALRRGRAARFGSDERGPREGRIRRALTELEKARHEIPMGSLNKAVSEGRNSGRGSRAATSCSRRRKSHRSPGIFVAEKLDGISIEVIYKNGKIAEAITRGDGEWGERITTNVARMKGVPTKIKDKRLMSVRGEIILRLSDMKRHFPGVTSPRNMAAGAFEALRRARRRAPDRPLLRRCGLPQHSTRDLREIRVATDARLRDAEHVARIRSTTCSRSTNATRRSCAASSITRSTAS